MPLTEIIIDKKLAVLTGALARHNARPAGGFLRFLAGKKLPPGIALMLICSLSVLAWVVIFRLFRP